MSKVAKIVNQWFQYANVDLIGAKSLFDLNDKIHFRNIGFLCQQSAEKSLKGFLAHRKIKFSKTHDLKILADLAIESEPSLKSALAEVDLLTKYAVIFRYPDAEVKTLTKKEIKKSINQASKIYTEISQLIPFNSAFKVD